MARAETPEDWVEWAAETPIGARVPHGFSNGIVLKALAERLLILESSWEEFRKLTQEWADSLPN